MYDVIPTIGSEENSMAFYLKSETDSYYFSLAFGIALGLLKNIQIIMLLPFETILCCGEWLKHNYYFKYYLCEAELSYYRPTATKMKYRNGLTAAPDMIL